MVLRSLGVNIASRDPGFFGYVRELRELQMEWAEIAPILSIRNEREYDRAVKHLNQLIDEIGDKQRHPLYGLLDALGTVIHAYEESNHQLPQASGSKILRYLMEEHGVTQAELPEVGSQGVVSKILSGKRELNARQIAALAGRFGVSPAVFF
jgi:HTH-type transcriptional regulator/antitoxin HigA